MRGLLFATGVAIVGLASACAGETAADGGPSLSAAANNTLDAEGFHIEGTFTFEGMTVYAEGHYVAPDRMTMSSNDGSATTVTIVIGRAHYISEPDDPSKFLLWTMQCDVGVDTFIPALAVVRHAEGVEQDGGSFTFGADGNYGTQIEGEARVDDGYLVELTLRYRLPRISQLVEERWAFSDFRATARIEPPPESQVLDDSRLDVNPPIVPQTGQPPVCP